MKDICLTPAQQQAVGRVFDWMTHGMPVSAAGDGKAEPELPSGVALPPNERGCGRAYPIRGVNPSDLTEWCEEHKT